jgi:endonuclease/exonuclease/phosphatase family metal-dependent hydrolase
MCYLPSRMPLARLLNWLPLALLLVLIAAETTADFPPITSLRVATWNIETVGEPGSDQYRAALDILRRIDADVVALNEIASSNDSLHLAALASEAGYTSVVVPASNPFGPDRNAFLTSLPVLAQGVNTSALLSGDPLANDLSRLLVEITVDAPGDAIDLTLVVGHWKSGTGNDDEFRRVVESYRVAQSVWDLDPLYDAWIFLGDVNEEIDDIARSPAFFQSAPAGLPTSFSLGADLQSELEATGLDNDPFAPLEGAGATAIPALQLDGSDATRPTSGRRLDYILASSVLMAAGVEAEVYDSLDEGLPGGRPKSGGVPPAGSSALASDHLPVFADIGLPQRCGDGRLDPGEACDDGGNNGSAASCCTAGCVFKPDGPASCDGNICTRSDTCTAGVCTPGDCATGQPCAICGTGRCEELSGSCECGS